MIAFYGLGHIQHRSFDSCSEHPQVNQHDDPTLLQCLGRASLGHVVSPEKLRWFDVGSGLLNWCVSLFARLRTCEKVCLSAASCLYGSLSACGSFSARLNMCRSMRGSLLEARNVPTQNTLTSSNTASFEGSVSSIMCVYMRMIAWYVRKYVCL